MGRIFAAMLAAGLLGACAAGGPSPGGLNQGLPPGWTRSAPPELTLAARHCYRTLARIDCHARPLTAETSRKVGFFDAPAGL